MHSGAKIVNIAAFLATCTFNNGVTSLLEIMNVLGISVGSGAHLYAAQEDETRIAKAELQAQEQTKEERGESDQFYARTALESGHFRPAMPSWREMATLASL
ncbi:Uncharacterized protein DBV15_12842 [Temnothorax longispinosus]|uniref:Uncharacterized protein n=1 Tax=Temnothorax longispinosus TaxID=300112 RepID=A0A4S2KR48_9HYME|nr:Uncharacterized protein DBV15_12842 [Temnothorax longispinosus]